MSKILKANQIQTIVLYANFIKASNKVDKTLDKLIQTVKPKQ